MKTILSILFFLCACAFCQAREIRGKIVDSSNRPVAEATAIASVNDSVICVQLSDKKGMIMIQYEGHEPIDVEVQAIGFEAKGIRVESGIPNFAVQLKESILNESDRNTTLREVTIEADKSGTVKRLANGNRFFLSSKARAMKDPFMALKEIPTLISDPFNASVKTLDGQAPLILINGVELNSGIKPILPEHIEYVEVIDAVPARYLARGVTSIVNIKLREHRPPYVWTEWATRHEFPVRNGFGVGYFEVGNEKFSLYGRASTNYTHHDDSEGSVHLGNQGYGPDNAGYTQDKYWETRRNNYTHLGELQFKYVPTSKDYFALQLYETSSKAYSKTMGTGTFQSDVVKDYATNSSDKNRSSIFTSSAYYKHEFSKMSHLEVIAGYNNNHNKLVTDGWETFGDKAFNMNSHFDNMRNSGHIDINYAKNYAKGSSLTISSLTSFLHDRITLQSQPTFNHSNYKEMLSGTYAGQVTDLFYMVSLGAQATWLKTRDKTNRYVRPIATVSAAYQLNSHNNLGLTYSVTNEDPSAGQLNPYNTSTDSLLVVRGNPDLVPQMNQGMVLSYSFSKKAFYLSVYTGADLYTDLIEACGFTDDKGIYTSTYENKGKFRDLSSGVTANYRFGNNDYSASIRCGVQYIRVLYSSHSPKDLYGLDFSVSAWLKKFYLGADFHFNPKSYTDISVIRELRPTGQVQVNYNITPNLYVAVCLQGFAGNQKTRVITNDGTYKSVSLTKLTETGFRPWILIRWNIRKNVKRRIKMGNVLNSTEKGINLKE